MKDINTFVLIGRLTADPEIKMTLTNTMVANITLAVNGIKTKDGNEPTHFLPMSMFGKTAELVSKYCTKGHRVAVRGHIVWKSYSTKDGNKISKIALSVDEIQFLERNKSHEEITEQFSDDEDFMMDIYSDDNLPF